MELEDSGTRTTIGIGGGGNYGSPADYPVHERDIYIPAAMGWDEHWQSDQSAAEWIKNHLREKGVIK